jgi:anti-sigma factor ChrR (cupin superfamily)
MSDPLAEERASTEHPSDDDIELYARDRLAPLPSARIATHLEQCQYCRDRLARAVILINDFRSGLR